MRIFNGWAVCVLSAIVPWVAVDAAQQTANAPIKQVTVYANMARVMRLAVVAMPAGDHTVLIENLPTTSDPNSFRVEVPGESGVNVMNYRHELKEISSPPKRNMNELFMRRDSLFSRRDAIRDHRMAFQAQKELLSAFNRISQQTITVKAEEGSLNVGQWDSSVLILGRRLAEVSDSIRAADRAEKEVNEQIKMCNLNIDNSGENDRKTSRSVYIDLQSFGAVTCTVLVSYLIPGASWIPSYDARLSADGKLVSITAFARITQNTGEPWDSVQLVLSTAAPGDNVGPGDYRPIALNVSDSYSNINKTITVCASRDIIEKFQTSAQVSISQESIGNDNEQDASNESEGVVFVRGGRAGEAAYTVNGLPIGDPQEGSDAAAELSLAPNIPVTFKARRLESVKPGQEPIRTSIGQWSLAAETKIIARPRSLEGAYRIVTVTNQDEAPLLAGSVALFSGGEYIGQWSLDRPVPPNAPFELPFGRESRVSVERKQTSVIRDREKKETKVDQTVRFTLKNHSVFTSTIQLEEPLPVALDNRIKVRVDADNLPRPTIDSQGKAIWTITLAPGQTDSLAVPIHVSFPSGVRISGL